MSVNVLLVEDNAADAVLFQTALDQVGLAYSIDWVTDGEVAIERVLAVPTEGRPLPGLIVLDLNLPRVSGRQVLERIRHVPELTSVPLVVLTTSTSERDVVEFYGYPPECYFVKPPTFGGLKQVVREIEEYRRGFSKGGTAADARR